MQILQKFKALLGMVKGDDYDFRPIKKGDLEAIMAIERQVYDYPWSEHIFKDCLRAGYRNWAFIKGEQFIGYAITSVAVGEAHILNICIAPACQKKGLGRVFLNMLFSVMEKEQVSCVFLEVRPSNISAIKLYQNMGFKKIGQRKNYYRHADGKEDAWVYSMDLPIAQID